MKNKKILKTFLLIILTISIIGTTAFAITTSYSTEVTTGYFGKSSSQSSTDEAIDYIAVTTFIMSNGVVKNSASDDGYGQAIIGPINASWSGLGTKTGKGYHSFSNQSPWLNKNVWSYDS